MLRVCRRRALSVRKLESGFSLGEVAFLLVLREVFAVANLLCPWPFLEDV